MANLTLLYGLKDRPDFLIRTLQYLRRCNTEFDIFFADGSNFENHISHLKILSDFQDVPNSYIYYGFDNKYIDFYKKIYNALSIIKTEFVVLACDDDFYNFDELNIGTQFLRNNPGFSTYSGLISNFTVSNTNFHSNINAFGSPRMMKFCYEGINRNICSEKIAERLKCLKNEKPWESIHYTKNLYLCFQGLVELKINSYYYFEYFLKLISIYSGKSFCSERLLLLRQDNSINSTGALITNDCSLFEDDRAIIILNYFCYQLQKYFNVNPSEKEELTLQIFSNFILLLHSNGKSLIKNNLSNYSIWSLIKSFFKKVKLIKYTFRSIKFLKSLIEPNKDSNSGNFSSFINLCFSVIEKN